MVKTTEKKNKGGRPKKQINWNQVKKLCEIQCTGEEIASIVNVSYETLQNKIKEEFDNLVAKGKMIDEEGKNLVNDYFKTIEELKNEADEKFADKLNGTIEKVEGFLQQLKK